MNATGESATTRRSAWREPMVWLVAAIPAAAVVATFALLAVAARSSGNNDSVADRVQRTAQVQVADLGPDAQARAMRLSAVVRSDGRRVEVLPVDGAFDRSAPLLLSLRHPARADLDRTLRLSPGETGWHGGDAFALDHDWNVQLQSADGAWRLQGRWIARQQAVYLHPSLGDE